MLKSNVFWVILLAVLIVVSMAVIVFAGNSPGKIATIYSAGQPVHSIDLEAVTEPYMIMIVTATATVTEKSIGVIKYDSSTSIPDDGHFNIIEIDNGRIRVAGANCPGGDCVSTGWRTGSLRPIVCLPHNLIIQLSGETNIDAIIG